MAGDGLYLAASEILRKVSEGKGAVRTLCYSSSINNKKALYALVLETARHLHLLRHVIKEAEWIKLANRSLKALPRNVKRVDEYLAAVLLQDFLYAEQLKCSPELQKLVESSKARLRAEKVKAQLLFRREGRSEGLQADDEEAQVPRYVRINRCLVKTDEEASGIIRRLANDTGVEEGQIVRDPHVPDLLVLPPGTDLTGNELYRRNLIILQDKASCFPPVILNPPRGAQVMDACAAPGNKTSQLCALVGPEGRVWAFERDSRRFETLVKLTTAAGAGASLTHRLADFLTVDPNDPEYANVTHVLCDPSCSGSGMPMSLERSLSNSSNKPAQETDNQRLVQLSKFQCMIVKHAMKFPSVQRVVYSTCSIHAQENENVVAEILRDCPQFRLVPRIFPEWPRRGLPEFAFAEDVIRADAKSDHMNGFFVALFERK